MELIPGHERMQRLHSLSHGMLSSFLLQEMSFLCLALGVVEGSVWVWPQAGSSLHHPVFMKASSSLPMSGSKSQKSDRSRRVMFSSNEPIAPAQGNLPSGQKGGHMIGSPLRSGGGQLPKERGEPLPNIGNRWGLSKVSKKKKKDMQKLSSVGQTTVTVYLTRGSGWGQTGSRFPENRNETHFCESQYAV